MDNKDQTKGKLKQALGDLTDNKELHDKGRADEKAGDAKEFVEKVGDKVGELIDNAKRAVTKN